MNEAKKKFSDLMTQYPLLYADRNASMTKTCMCWGIECGLGWYNIIDRLSQRLEELIEELPESERERCCAAQVKEKYGTLRFYMTVETDEMSKAIEHAEDLSEITCEFCGEPGKIRDESWLVCRCDACGERTKK